MAPDALSQSLAALFLLGLLAAAVAVQMRVIRQIATAGGQVRTEEFRMPDALVAGVLAAFFVGMGVAALFKHAEKSAVVKIEQVMPGSFIFVLFVVGIAGFLKYRGLRLIPLFGLDRLTPLRTAGWALALLFAAFVLAGLANAVSVLALRGQAEQQPLVQLFRDVAQGHDYAAMAQIFLAGVVLAPICEEVIFRGFFYAVGKRYLGPLGSGLATALLFAAFHLSLTALAGLFVLALCLTLAYERTGSLAVPIGMHALYNFTSLCVIYLQARGILPAS